ncbi:MAG: type 1 glutamine amidotransferase domain-containing protein [bacterium]
MGNLDDVQVGVLLEESFEDLEFHVPRMRLIEEGADVMVLDTGRKEQYEGKHGLTATPDIEAKNCTHSGIDAVVIPGGWAPDKLRRDEGVLELVRHCYKTDGKIIGSICHAGWVPVSAGIIDGHRVTGSTGIKDDVENAGGTWVDEPAIRDGSFVFGRVVKDIPNFCREIVNTLQSELTSSN